MFATSLARAEVPACNSLQNAIARAMASVQDHSCSKKRLGCFCQWVLDHRQLPKISQASKTLVELEEGAFPFEGAWTTEIRKIEGKQESRLLHAPHMLWHLWAFLAFSCFWHFLNMANTRLGLEPLPEEGEAEDGEAQPWGHYFWRASLDEISCDSCDMTAAAPPSPASKDESESVTRLSDARWMEQNIAVSCSHCRIQFLGTGRGECGFQPKCRFDSLKAFIRLSEVRERGREREMQSLMPNIIFMHNKIRFPAYFWTRKTILFSMPLLTNLNSRIQWTFILQLAFGSNCPFIWKRCWETTDYWDTQCSRSMGTCILHKISYKRY